MNQALNFIKQKRRQNDTFADKDIGNLAYADDDTEPDIGELSAEIIHDMIRNLPDGYRMVFNLYAIEGKSHKEIAEILGIKADSSASQFHRAKNMLAREIEKYKQNNKDKRS